MKKTMLREILKKGKYLKDENSKEIPIKKVSRKKRVKKND